MPLYASQVSECNMIGYRSTHMANPSLFLISDLIEAWKASSVVKTACAARNILNWMIYCRDHSFELPAIKAASYRIRTSSDVSLIAFAHVKSPNSKHCPCKMACRPNSSWYHYAPAVRHIFKAQVNKIAQLQSQYILQHLMNALPEVYS
jgi:hypothetical protein